MEQQSITSLNIFFFFRPFYLSPRFLPVVILEPSVNYYILVGQLVSAICLEAISCAFLDALNAV